MSYSLYQIYGDGGVDDRGDDDGGISSDEGETKHQKTRRKTREKHEENAKEKTKTSDETKKNNSLLTLELKKRCLLHPFVAGLRQRCLSS